MNASNVKIVIIGGGLAGLCAAIHLAQEGIEVILIEKNDYPKHKVCGEYISNEVLPYLKFLGFDPFSFGAKKINEFELTTRSNKRIHAKLPLGGFGMSRYEMDYQLFKIAREKGVSIIQDTVISVEFKEGQFQIITKNSSDLFAEIAIGAFGKRSQLDISLERSFIKRKSPYLGVKIHVSGDFPDDKVALHNFKGGYCGVSKVENDHINLCYITNYKEFKPFKDIEAFQAEVVSKNKALKQLFDHSEPKFEKPLSISQISFETKTPVENHILMCGDSAGMIHPLCGNGMGMAIRSAQLASLCIIDYLQGKIRSREELEQRYRNQWRSNFRFRLGVGHGIAFLFRQNFIAAILLRLLQLFPFLIPGIIRMTHGKPMIVE
jgi:flavin-dependent dehydrogenase